MRKGVRKYISTARGARRGPRRERRRRALGRRARVGRSAAHLVGEYRLRAVANLAELLGERRLLIHDPVLLLARARRHARVVQRDVLRADRPLLLHLPQRDHRVVHELNARLLLESLKVDRRALLLQLELARLGAEEPGAAQLPHVEQRRPLHDLREDVGRSAVGLLLHAR